MNPLKVYWPFKPYLITQPWGNVTDAYSKQFNDPSFQRHNGVDANIGKRDVLGNLVSEYPVYCSVEGFTVQKVDFQQNGGGHELWLISNEPVQMFERTCYAYMPLCHAKTVLVKEGYQPALGELLMIADNTGFSTGIHTHMGLYRVDINPLTKGIIKLDTNDAEGSFDPALFFTGEYAVDHASLSTLITSNLRYYKYRRGM